MAVTSTQVLTIRATRKGRSVVGTCRIIKNAHRRADPIDEGVPQREVLFLDESGQELVRITKFFRHLLVECNGSYETTSAMPNLTPDNMRLLGENLLSANDRRRLLSKAIGLIEELQRQEHRTE